MTSTERGPLDSDAEESEQIVDENIEYAYVKQIRCLTRRANILATLCKYIYPDAGFLFDEAALTNIIGEIDSYEKLDFLRRFVETNLEICRMIIEEQKGLVSQGIHTLGQAVETFCKNVGNEDGRSICQCHDWHMTAKAFDYCCISSPLHPTME